MEKPGLLAAVLQPPHARTIQMSWFEQGRKWLFKWHICFSLIYQYIWLFLQHALNTTSSYRDRKGNGNPLQYSCLENPMGRGAWWAAVHGVSKSRTRLSDFTFTFHFHALEKEMTVHSSILAWRIPGTAEPGGLPSKGSHRVGHDWSDLTAAAAASYRVGKLFYASLHPQLRPGPWLVCFLGVWIVNQQ